MNNELNENGASFETGDYDVSVVRTHAERVEVECLLRRMYTRRGYEYDAAKMFPPTARQSTLQVRRRGLTVGTLTVRADSKTGLLADALYHEELEFFRRFDGRVCELTGLAIAPGENSSVVLNHMFRAAYLVACRRERVSDVVIEVNPRHVAHYKRLLGFRQVGPERTCDRVGAPAVLLHLDPRDIDRRVGRDVSSGARAADGCRAGSTLRRRYSPFIRFAASVNSARKSG